jgi:hypothetical protein
MGPGWPLFLIYLLKAKQEIVAAPGSAVFRREVGENAYRAGDRSPLHPADRNEHKKYLYRGGVLELPSTPFIFQGGRGSWICKVSSAQTAVS